MKRKIGVFLILLGVVLNVKAQAPEPNPIQTGVPLLLILSDARAAGQGDVGVATTSDANSIYHNSAKMAFNTSEYSVGVNYTPWLQSLVDGLFVGGGSIINRIDERSAWGADIRYFSLGDIDLYDDGGNSTGSANPYEFSASGSYALKLSDYFSMGVALRYMRSDFKITGTDQNLNTVNGFGVDVSGFYQSAERNYGSFNGRIRAGFNISNMGPKVSYTAGREDFIPTQLRLGGGFDFIIDNYNTLALTLQLSKLLVPTPPIRDESGNVIKGKEDNVGWVEGMFQSFGDAPYGFGEEMQEVNIGFGAEYVYNDSFALRGGYYHESEMKGNRQYFTMGGGLKAKAFNIDLSYLVNAASAYNPLESTLRFSLSFDLGDIYDNF
ncbi:type IX secretion system outer membrane channel protein PorV [Flavicella sp.]|uniref:type IX secretion system outer membrane channel protein PorV n=1 Tax=Flavicella sp. TaxID=2957742 RepID=UPI00261D0D4E|nr:type IX secretion system outer membrane channel protein PorV [Flavicella sp.]MDG1804493.1 type IX secretion system outer membrane channel protein PorV [Flavicella sp.]